MAGPSQIEILIRSVKQYVETIQVFDLSNKKV